MLNPGNDTVTFHYPGVVNDRLHNVAAAPSTTTVVRGCSMQPIRVSDHITDTAFSNATDTCIAPWTAFTATVEAEWFVTFTPTGGRPYYYRVLGSKPWRWFTGAPDHITFMCRSENG